MAKQAVAKAEADEQKAAAAQAGESSSGPAAADGARRPGTAAAAAAPAQPQQPAAPAQPQQQAAPAQPEAPVALLAPAEAPNADVARPPSPAKETDTQKGIRDGAGHRRRRESARDRTGAAMMDSKAALVERRWGHRPRDRAAAREGPGLRGQARRSRHQRGPSSPPASTPTPASARWSRCARTRLRVPQRGLPGLLPTRSPLCTSRRPRRSMCRLTNRPGGP